MTNEDTKTIYQRDGYCLEDRDGKLYLVRDKASYLISDYPYEPCLYIRLPDRTFITIHNSFTAANLRNAARTDGAIEMVTGDIYDISGVCRLMLKAVELSKESVDISYVEGQCFIGFLKERGAVSAENAVDLAEAGMKNPNVMNVFIHSKKVGRTADGLFYLLPENNSDTQADGDGGSFSRLISGLVRFGCGYRTLSGERQYYAWHGYPNRNDDLITYAQISGEEFDRIEKEYPCQIEADRDTAERFRRKYVEGHPVIKEGWNLRL